MKDIITDFKAIFKKDKGLLWWMAANFLFSIFLFVMPLVHLNPGEAQVFVRYSDITSYNNDSWWYLISFSVMAVTMGIGHILISARLFAKRGRDIARLFLGMSSAMIITAISFLHNIIGEI